MSKILNSKHLISVLILASSIFVSFLIIAQAQTGTNIAYPVKELGNCQNESACRIYCDKPENILTCVSFAEKHNLISSEEAARAKAFAKVGTGPGGCKNKTECEVYCDNPANIEACLNFAEENGMMSPEELGEAKQVAKALREGANLPGNCRNKKECESYCNDIDHINECVAFAEKAGFIPPEELKEAKQVAQAMAKGIRPPGNCRGKNECDAYCSDPNHIEECFAFAEAAGFIPPEELEQARKVIPLMKRGEMPGGCKTKQECENYCSNDANIEECANFALKAGFMKQEEYEMFKKTGGKGPGGCRGKEECEAFCNNPANQEVCFGFAEEHGLIPEEQVRGMKEGMTKMREGLGQAPPAVTDCIRNEVGTENFDKIQAGTLTPGPQIGDQVRNCFEKFVPQGMMGPGGPPGMPSGPEGVPQGQFRGPGGCTTPDECMKYCSDPSHKEECGKFSESQIPAGMPTREGENLRMIPEGMQLPGGMRPPEGMMQFPQGQNIPEEYKQYQGITPPAGIEQFQPQQLQQQYIAPPPTETAPPPQSLLRYSPFGLFLKTFLGQ